MSLNEIIANWNSEVDVNAILHAMGNNYDYFNSISAMERLREDAELFALEQIGKSSAENRGQIEQKSQAYMEGASALLGYQCPVNMDETNPRTYGDSRAVREKRFRKEGWRTQEPNSLFHTEFAKDLHFDSMYKGMTCKDKHNPELLTGKVTDADNAFKNSSNGRDKSTAYKIAVKEIEQLSGAKLKAATTLIEYGMDSVDAFGSQGAVTSKDKKIDAPYGIAQVARMNDLGINKGIYQTVDENNNKKNIRDEYMKIVSGGLSDSPDYTTFY